MEFKKHKIYGSLVMISLITLITEGFVENICEKCKVEKIVHSHENQINYKTFSQNNTMLSASASSVLSNNNFYF